MFSPGQILIGANVAYTATPVLRGATQSVNTGNIFVLDKNLAILTAGSTVSDSDHIYFAQILSDTVTYANPAGTSVTEKKMIVSNPIFGNSLKNVVSKGYVAEQAKVMAVILPTLVIGANYQLKIRFLDRDAENIPDGQFSATYDFIATATNPDTDGALFAAQINNDVNARVTAAYTSGDNTLTLTAKTISETLNSLGKYRYVNFDMSFNVYYDPIAASYLTKGQGRQLVQSAACTVTNPLIIGNGTWREVRDIESSYKGYNGYTNRNQFPQPDAFTTWYTVKDTMYNLLTIEGGVAYSNSANRPSTTDTVTVLALPTGASQTTNILNALNPWLNSVGVANITF